jgi:NADPH2:quinone reductase
LLDPNPVQYMNAQVVFKNLLIKGFGVRSFLAGLDDERKQQMINGLINLIGKDSFQLSAVNYQPEQFKQAFGDSSSNKVLFNF